MNKYELAVVVSAKIEDDERAQVIEKVKALSDEEIGQYVIGAAEGVDEEEAEIVFEAVLQMIISDNVLASAEVSTALAIAEALDIEQETAVLLLADLIKSEPELEIEF